MLFGLTVLSAVNHFGADEKERSEDFEGGGVLFSWNRF